MNFCVRFTPEARQDLDRLFEFIVERENGNWIVAQRAIDSIKSAIGLLEFSPFNCRKAVRDNPFLRELVIPFGASGYVALFEIEAADTVTVLAVRHQREDDYR